MYDSETGCFKYVKPAVLYLEGIKLYRNSIWDNNATPDSHITGWQWKWFLCGISTVAELFRRLNPS